MFTGTVGHTWLEHRGVQAVLKVKQKKQSVKRGRQRTERCKCIHFCGYSKVKQKKQSVK